MPGRLSSEGRELVADLGRRRSEDGLAAVFSSDLTRAVETASIAFGGRLPILLDWR
ncbi:MAG: histidine phosphatase family protein, partial [Geodermatophilaceae bacterium]|nr:histidine phosphatase family protein [Geodermatophilaceae bacterium]